MAERYHNGVFEPCAVKQYHVSKTIERTDTFPITINADGNALLDYRIYGANGGVGDRTENLYNPMAPDVEAGCYYDAQNLIHYRTTSDVHSESGFIPVTEGSYNFSLRRLLSGFRTFINFYDTSKNFVNNLMDTMNANGNYALNVSATGFIRFNTVANYADQYMLTSGSTAEYAPYGYKLPMSVSDGMTSTTTPIYIGSDPLGEDEYVDYGEQKVYRMINGVLTPTDPPVPLPEIPTVDGTTIIDYDGTPKPSQMYIKYNSHGGWEPCTESVRRNGVWVQQT